MIFLNNVIFVREKKKKMKNIMAKIKNREFEPDLIEKKIYNHEENERLTIFTRHNLKSFMMTRSRGSSSP